MRLREFQGSAARTPSAIATELQNRLGKLVRIGGSKRYYEVNDGKEMAAVYLIDGTLKAFGLAWPRGMEKAGVSAVYVWNKFDINNSPDMMAILPTTGEMPDLINLLADWIIHPSTGKVFEDLNLKPNANWGNSDFHMDEDEELDEAKRTNDEDFIKMARATMPDKVHKLSLSDLVQIAAENDVQIPMTIRTNPNLKIDAHHWNLSGGSGPTSADDNQGLSTALGAPVDDTADNVDPVYQDTLDLAKAKSVNRMAASGKVYLMGRKPTGAFFRIPGLEQYTAQLERILTNQMEAHGGSDRLTMEQQYEMLHDKVRLVAGGKSAFIKSLLITGAPSSGKTFSVMQTITKELGLVSGKDFVVKKGSITPISMYRTLIEQIDGMVIFDDCDSVVEDKNGINMLKGALDTDPVREISYDTARSMNTAAMDEDRREEVVNAVSRILRNKASQADLNMFSHMLKKKKQSKPSREEPEEPEDFDDDFDIDIDDDENDSEVEPIDHQMMHEVQEYLLNHLPNKIDFKGRIIFISNMDEGEWDSAILTRAFTVNMEFTSGEMLDYIDKIKGNLKTPNVTDEQKQEVMDYIRERFVTGKLKRQVNFRLVQQAFDLRLASNWQMLINML